MLPTEVSNALSEKDIVEVAEGKYRADDPVHTNREFRDRHDGADTITHIQRLWFHLPVILSPSEPRGCAGTQKGFGTSVY